MSCLVVTTSVDFRNKNQDVSLFMKKQLCFFIGTWEGNDVDGPNCCHKEVVDKDR